MDTKLKEFSRAFKSAWIVSPDYRRVYTKSELEDDFGMYCAGGEL